MIEEKCTVIVSSCDEYKDVWDSCFKILSNEWSDIKFPVILVAEKENYLCPYMDVHVFNSKKVMVWGKRIRNCLKSLNSEYVIFLLDDYYPLEKVDQKQIEQCIEWMEQDKNIAVFCFNNVPGRNIRDNKYENFEKRHRKSEYKFNCQPAIWRRDRLIKFIKSNETPWDFEIIGSIRSAKYKDDFYCAIEGTPYIFNHQFAKYGLRQGKWGVATKELFDKYDIDMDFSVRGFFDNGNITEPKKIDFLQKVKRHLKWRKRNIRIRFEKLKIIFISSD